MSKKLNSGILIAILSFTILPFYQNCSNSFDFAKEANFALTQGEAEIVDFYIDPNSWENRPKINISAVVDNSHSMADIQAKVSSALENSLTPLSDFSGEIELYSTTQDTDGEDAKLSVTAQSVEQDDMYRGIKRVSSILYGLPESYTYDSQDFRGPLLYTPENLNQISANFGNSVTKLGIKGSSNEQGICSLLRVVNKAKNTNGALNVFLLVSDQDDSTDFSKCIDSSHKVVFSSEADKTIQCSGLSDAAAAAIPECRFKADLKISKPQESLTRMMASASLPDRVDTQGIKEGFSRASVKAFYQKPDTFKVYYDYKVENVVTKIKIDTENIGYSIKDEGLYQSNLVFNKSTNMSNASCASKGFSLNNNQWQRSCTASEKNYFLSLNATDNEGNPVTMQEPCSAICTNLEPVISYTDVKNAVTGDIVGNCPSDLSNLKANHCSNKEANCDIKCINRSYGVSSYSRTANHIEASCSNSFMSNDSSFSKVNEWMELAALSTSHKNSIVSRVNENNFVKVEYRCTDYKFRVLNARSSWVKSASPLSNIECTSTQKQAISDKFGRMTPGSFSCSQKNVDQGSQQVVINLDEPWNGQTSCSAGDLDLLAEEASTNVGNISNCIRSEVSRPDLSKTVSLNYAGAKVCDSLSKPEISAQITNALDENPGYSTNSCINKGKYGSYMVKIDKQEDDRIIQPIIEWQQQGDYLEDMAKFMADNLQFQLASFTTPSEASPEYNKCPPPSVPGAPVPFDEGVTYTRLVDKINAINPDLAKSYNICDSDYSPALQHVVDSVIKQAELTYRISLAPYESVYKVFLVDYAGKEQQLEFGEFDIINNSLIKINKSAVDINQEISSIRIQIWRDLIAKEELELRAPASN